MSTTDEIVRLRAEWDEADAMVAELEDAGEDMAGARFQLELAAAAIDYAERLNQINA